MGTMRFGRFGARAGETDERIKTKDGTVMPEGQEGDLRCSEGEHAGTKGDRR